MTWPLRQRWLALYSEARREFDCPRWLAVVTASRLTGSTARLGLTITADLDISIAGYLGGPSWPEIMESNPMGAAWINGRPIARPEQLRTPRRPWRTWVVHNLVAHPVSEVCHWFGLDRFGDWLHDKTVPEHEEGTGRG